MIPRVRVVVLNFNGGDLTLHCVESLTRVSWPHDRLDIVVVDNASTDGSADAVISKYPWIRVIWSSKNLGFAGGNNLALRELTDTDYVALLNNDTTVEPGWLSPLVKTLEADPSLGAACSKILFAPRFLSVRFYGRSFKPGRGDARDLLVKVSGIRVDGVDRWRDSQFAEGWWGIERGGGSESIFQWARPGAALRIPTGSHVSLRLASRQPTDVEITCGDSRSTYEAGPTPQWRDIRVMGKPFDVINNVGNRLVHGGYGGDRGYMQMDEGQFEEEQEVFAWCGASVLMRRRYLEEVGLFDPRLYLYYEDFDLSWRGRARGWRYQYVPGSVVRHVHAATSAEGSALFTHYVERNRLLVLAKNAPWPLAAHAASRYLLATMSYAKRDIVNPALRGHRPNTTLTRRRLRAFGGYLKLLPGFLAHRHHRQAWQSVPDDELMRWAVPQ
jgi:GT2 family glycosyltransferase